MKALLMPWTVAEILAMMLLFLSVILRSRGRQAPVLSGSLAGFFIGGLFIWPLIFAVFSVLILHTAIAPRYFCLSNIAAALAWGLFFQNAVFWQKASLIALFVVRTFDIPASLVDYRRACGWLAGSTNPKHETVVLVGSADALRYHQRAFFQKYQPDFVFKDLREVDMPEAKGINPRTTRDKETARRQRKVVVFGSGDKILGPRNRIFEDLREDGYLPSEIQRFRHLDVPTYTLAGAGK